MILVTGATGYIGNRLVKKLVADGHKVRAMVIKNDPLLDSLKDVDCEIIEGDILDIESLRKPLEGVKTVFHLAAVLVSHDKSLFHKINYEGSKNTVAASVDSGVEHFIYISAAAADYKRRTTYGESKIKSEALMKKRGNTNFTIIRPTLLYGYGGSQELKIYVNNLRKFPFFIPVVDFGRCRKRPVCVDDVVSGLSLLVNKPVSYGKIYNFSGGTDVNMWEFTRLICITFGISKPMVPVPLFICDIVARMLPLVLKRPVLSQDTILGVTMDANFSYVDAAKDIGYQPVSLIEGFRKSFLDESDKFI